MANSTSKKTATARAKAKTTKPASKKTSKMQQLTKKSRIQASVTPSSLSQTSGQVSISNEEGAPTHVGSVLDIDSTDIMETSDGKEGGKGTAENPMKMSD
jgi:hypothetical protein